MWDDYIRGAKAKRYYEKLDIVKSNEWKYSKFTRDADGYINFLKEMQYRFSHLSLTSHKKTLAKAIDEFNYVKITLPIQKMEKENKKNKSKKK
jgi:folate-dependent tRNA-U54 methylase TrmFO/GidA